LGGLALEDVGVRDRGQGQRLVGTAAAADPGDGERRNDEDDSAHGAEPVAQGLPVLHVVTSFDSETVPVGLLSF
jgi:hypothetical protein